MLYGNKVDCVIFLINIIEILQHLILNLLKNIVRQEYVRCSIYVDLHPGQRYEVSAKTISENTSSNIISKSFALQPAFDMETFGLQLSVSE